MLHPIAAGGGIPPVLVMVYGPRNQEELEEAWKFVQASYENALGDTAVS